MKQKNKMLLITRSYPPMVGGLEQYCYDFHHEMKKYSKVKLITRKEKESTIGFLIRASGYCLIHGREYTHIHLGDGLLVLLARWIKLMSKSKLSVSVHALEILHNIKLYQYLIKYNFKKIDTTICVSENTAKEAKKRNAKKIIVIPNAIRVQNMKVESKINLEKFLKTKIKDKMLFSIGRQIPRKGTSWFVENVMTKLKEYQYVVAGTGPEVEKIKKIIKKRKLENIILAGRVSDEQKEGLFDLAKWFIMPNIRVPNDAEGFGITIIEAGIKGCPVIASNVDGIPSAVIEGKTGFLVEEKEAKEFINKITTKKLDRKEVQKIVNKTYNWEETGKIYAKSLQLI